jgi:hypothetical protein
MKTLHIHQLALCLTLTLACSDPYANLDESKMTPKERAEVCASIKDPDKCNELGLGVNCAYPPEFKAICLKGTQCVIESAPSRCMDTISQLNNAIQTPPTIIYKKGDASDALWFHHSANPYGWSACQSYEVGLPEICKCADEIVERVEGDCP